MKKYWIVLAAALGFAPPAWADNVAHCEALLMQTLPGEDGTGEAQIASYRPAVNFLASLYDEEDGHMAEIDGFPIRAIMCRRNDVIPSEQDYPILATGVPFILSQDFDSPDTDSLTVFWQDKALDYVYKGHPLSEESQEILESRLEDFTQRGKYEPPAELTVVDMEVEAEVEVEVEVESEVAPEVTKIDDAMAMIETETSLPPESEEQSPETSSEEKQK